MSKTMVPLGEVVDFIGGGTPSRDVKHYWNGDIPWASVKDFKGPSIDSTLESITREGLSASTSSLISAGHIIMPTRMALGKAAINCIDVAINQDLKALRLKIEVDTRYLLHAVLSRSKEIQSHGKGATVQGITIERLSAIQIPLPPLEEQRRIAEILDKASAIKSSNEKAAEYIVAARASLFDESFIMDGRLNNWEQAPLGELCDVQGGLQVTSARAVLPIRVPYLRVANVLRGKLDLGEIKEINCTQAELDRTRLQPKDLLVVEGHGNPNEIGRVGFWIERQGEMVHQNHLIRVRTMSNSLDPEFLCFYLNSHQGRRHLLKRANTTSGLNTISTSVVKSAPVIIPPLEKQRSFCDAIKTINTLEASLFARSALHAKLFASLLGEAF